CQEADVGATSAQNQTRYISPLSRKKSRQLERRRNSKSKPVRCLDTRSAALPGEYSGRDDVRNARGNFWSEKQQSALPGPNYADEGLVPGFASARICRLDSGL